MSGDCELKFESRRAAVVVQHGAVACSQPLAAQVGLDILKAGGNAADAAVATAAALAVTMPNSCGLGGDAFCLFYNAKDKDVRGVNGSGRAPSALTLEKLKAEGWGPDNPLPKNHGHTVTVPGAVAAMANVVEELGNKKLTLEQILEPAIKLAEDGFPVSETVAHAWPRDEVIFKDSKNPHGVDMLVEGRAPKWGEVFKNQNLAKTLKTIVSEGKAGFYKGRIAEAIVDVVTKNGGLLTTKDLANHSTSYVANISTDYKGLRVWEIPPNGQGLIALLALNILEEFDLKAMGHNSEQYIHVVLEAFRLASADGFAYIADPVRAKAPVKELLSKEYAAKRRQLIKEDKAMTEFPVGKPLNIGQDTVYLTTADKDGNACSFIFSNYHGFGSGLVPEGCGFTLQNRGLGFSLQEGHPNVVAPNKRPFHTIIPAMVTDAKTGELMCSYGVMGAFMQPQGHVQVLLNMLEFGMDPQRALDQSRFMLWPSGEQAGNVYLEEGIAKVEEVAEKLKKKGHKVQPVVTSYQKIMFGRGHAICKGAWWRRSDKEKSIADDKSVLWVGTDPRGDGQAAGY